MVEIIKQLRWSYVSIIYEESNYGIKLIIKAFEELEALLAKNDICIAVKEKLVKDSGVAEEIAYDSIVQKLLTKSRARGTFPIAGSSRADKRGRVAWNAEKIHFVQRRRHLGQSQRCICLPPQPAIGSFCVCELA
ncbi:unnamed protein product [Nesidiocoris tenuis]|uniref:Receptor ligand binding region domain-containing protein n=1 Tax=Nesidiocoris tenuis TaxID=355587 RepID=A0A6H5G154_9HEMI|nr:unnamed protein product [Nesidiocoris tenuis]